MNISDLLYVDEVKKSISNVTSISQQEIIMLEAIKKLRQKGYKDQEIEELFSVELLLKQQMNTVMLNSNERYLLLLKKVLGGK